MAVNEENKASELAQGYPGRMPMNQAEGAR